MADSKISVLSAVAAGADAQEAPVNDAGTTKKITLAQIKAYIAAVTSINITAPVAGITASGGPITSTGSITLALADDLAALEAISTTGIMARTAANTYQTRSVGPSVTARLEGIAVANGNGVTSNPTVGLTISGLTDAAVTGASQIVHDNGTNNRKRSLTNVLADLAILSGNTAVTPGSYTSTNLTVDAQGRITAAANGSGATPAGSTTQIQYNNAGAFGASANLAWDDTNRILFIGGGLGGNIQPVAAGVTDNGGFVQIFAQDGGATSGSGGAASLLAGNATDGSGGSLNLRGGNAGGTGNGGDANVGAGNGGGTSGNAGSAALFAGQATNGVGGSAYINASDAKGVGNYNGGDVYLYAGLGKGTGRHGQLQLDGSGVFTANGTTAVTLTSVGPAGASTTVRRWLTIYDAVNAQTLYIPCF